MELKEDRKNPEPVKQNTSNRREMAKDAELEHFNLTWHSIFMIFYLKLYKLYTVQ